MSTDSSNSSMLQPDTDLSREAPGSVGAGLACPECGAAVTGSYCSACGAETDVHRLTLHSLVHEVFHYFTHLDKGFGYTLKALFAHPGKMQREYVEGKRSRHQKPFSMFFLCGTICGLGFYFINTLHSRINGADSIGEADFFRHYFVLLQAAMTPVYAAITWLTFYRSRRNYAEVLVLILYMLSPTFFTMIVFQLPKLAFPGYSSEFLELAFLLVYNPITNWRFFGGKLRVNLLQSLIVILACFAASQAVSKLFQGWLH